MSDLQLQSERLILKLVTNHDLQPIHDLHTLEETDRFNTLGIPENIDETRELLKKWIEENQKRSIQRYTFAITLKEDSTFIGLFGLNLGKPKYKNAEVWFKFHFNHWNKGYATEVLKEILNFGFNTLNLHRIEAGCATENIGSIKVMEKVGMFREAHTRQLLPLKMGWADNYGYAKLSTD